MEQKEEGSKVVVTYVAAKQPYWGRGDTIRKACDEYRKAGGRRGADAKVAKVEWIPRAGEKGGPYVDYCGSIRVPGEFAGQGVTLARPAK